MGYTAIYMAEGFGRIAAVAFDVGGGLYFATLDETGRPEYVVEQNRELAGRALADTRDAK
jgi:hypothetical protein